MDPILRQARAEVRSHPLQSLLLILVLAAAAFLGTVALQAPAALTGAYERLLATTREAHLILVLDPRRVDLQEVRRQLAALPPVEGVRGPVPLAYADLLLGGTRVRHQIRRWPEDEGAVGRPLLVAGRPPEPDEADALLLDRNVAVYYGIDVGERVEIRTSQGWVPLKVVGLFVTAETCPYPNCNPPLALLSPAVSRLEGGGVQFEVRLRDPGAAEAVRERIATLLPPEVPRWTRTWQEVRGYVRDDLQPAPLFLLAFSLVAGLSALFLIAGHVAQAVRARTRTIGLLKAVGFTPAQVVAVYLLAYGGLAALAGLTGTVLGILGTGRLLHPFLLRFGGLPFRPVPLRLLPSLLGTPLVALLGALVPALRAARLTPVTALREGTRPGRRRNLPLPRLPLPLAVGLHRLLSRPLRTGLTVLGLTGAAVALVFAFVLRDTVSFYVAHPEVMGVLAKADLVLRPTDRGVEEAAIRAALASTPGIRGYMAEGWTSFRFPGEEETLNLRFRDGDPEAYPPSLIEGRLPRSADEVLVGYGLARERRIGVGEGISILLKGTSLNLRVVGIYRESSNQGRMLLLPLEAVRQVDPALRPSAYYLRLAPDADPEAVAAALQEALGEGVEVAPLDEAPPESMLRILRWVIGALALLLGGIAGLAVLADLWSRILEEGRELALLKAVGMTPGQLLILVLLGAAAMALPAGLLGLPLGVRISQALLNLAAEQVGFGPVEAVVGTSSLLAAPLLLTGLALVGALLPGLRAARIDPAAGLRYE